MIQLIYRDLFLLVVSLAAGINMASAQSELTLQDFSDSHKFISDHFIKQLSGVPAGFAPDSIQDFAPYLPANYDFEPVESNYQIALDYLHNYMAEHSEEKLWEHFGMSGAEPHDPIDPMAYNTCFKSLYYKVLSIYVTVSVCCFGSDGTACAGCIAGGLVLEHRATAQFKDCLEDTYGN